MKSKPAQRGNGFTMIELLVVVSIIGLLAAVALPKFGDMLEKSKEGATKSNQASLRWAVAAYYTDQQGVPPDTLDTQTRPQSAASRVPLPAFLPNYLERIPSVRVTGKNVLNGVHRNGGPGTRWPRSIDYEGADQPFALDSAGQGWRYDKASLGVWVNSAMLDIKGTPYSLYGYE